ncbi:uncharacterized protein LOC119727204 [Patiria miniata]|uniref:Uncharacterized protein n=1 Tax=Patiria miniata TaxID=46514 RepID=A0A913ZTA8_PATMI|nr:uncharacterized protein LOC119727204 [Patiria miniata]
MAESRDSAADESPSSPSSPSPRPLFRRMLAMVTPRSSHHHLGVSMDGTGDLSPDMRPRAASSPASAWSGHVPRIQVTRSGENSPTEGKSPRSSPLSSPDTERSKAWSIGTKPKKYKYLQCRLKSSREKAGRY